MNSLDSLRINNSRCLAYVQRLLLASVVFSLLFLGACDGGSGSNSENNVVVTPVEPPVVPPVEPPVEPACNNVVLSDDDPGFDSNTSSACTGFLVDSAVSGVAYETMTHQGVTGPEGDFQYEEGETVRFMLGDTLLGEVTGQEQITPFDLADSAVITGTPDIRDALEQDRSPFGDVTNLEEKELDPFHAVVNIAVLLQSLDHDADPKNGIEITPEVAALFQGVSLDVSQLWETFPTEIGLAHALGQANTQGLFSEPHGIANPAPALQALYESLGIDARTLAVSMEQRDEDGDGVPENIKTWQYDANGNVMREEEDNDGDGMPDAFGTHEYDVHGNVTREEGEGGVVSSISTYQYDAIGNVIHSETHLGGSVLGIFLDYEYDANGNVTREEIDGGGDGTVDKITTRQYDANGMVIREEIFSGSDHRGTPDTIETWQYDANGNVTRHEWDNNADGTPDRIESWQYDAKGNEMREEVDRHGDGTPNRIQTVQYDEDGNITRWESDSNADGLPDSITSYQYNTDGNVTRYEADNNGDGTLDKIETWQYDANGNVTRTEEDYGADGNPEHIHTYEYDANGNVTRDNDCRYQYDSEGYLTQEEGDCVGDGTPNRLVTYEYEVTGWGHIFAD